MGGWLLPAVTTVAIVVGVPLWLAHSWWFPYRPCPACAGRKGKGAGSTSRAYNRCRRCGGTGERVRVGALAVSKATGHPVRGQDKE